MNEDEPLNKARANTADVVTESGMRGCMRLYIGNKNKCGVFLSNNGERQATVTTAGERTAEKGLWMHASVYTYSTQAQMHKH